MPTLRGQPFGEETEVTLREGLRLEEVVATFGASEMTMNMEEFATILQSPPAELLNEFDFLGNFPRGPLARGLHPPGDA